MGGAGSAHGESGQIVYRLTFKLRSALSAAFLMMMLAGALTGHSRAVQAQGISSPEWSIAQTIPEFGDETNPPILIADQNRTVHAFASQQVGEGESLTAITYSQWTPDTGWTKPNDVLLSPFKNEARVLDAYLDEQGVFHLIFYGGDNTEAYLYYAKVHASRAVDPRAWSLPEPISTSMAPPSGVILGDEMGRLTVLSTDRRDGNGVYVVYSQDRGESWTEPLPIALTYTDKLIPYGVHAARDSSGTLHAIWQQVNVSGQGRGIFYARQEVGEEIWSEPIDLTADDEIVTELGTMTPAFLINNDELLAFYNINGKIVLRKSADGGNTWSETVQLFGRHIGVNGLLAPVVDGRYEVHLFFGQRIPETPDIHGMWHSNMRGAIWSEPEPIISGPQVVDMRGSAAFDPYDAQAVALQGNELLVTWRSDPGLKGNGVWFAHQQIDAPAFALAPIPAPSPTSVPQPVTAVAPVEATAFPAPIRPAERLPAPLPGAPVAADQPMLVVIAGLLPAGLLSAIMLLWLRRGVRT